MENKGYRADLSKIRLTEKDLNVNKIHLTNVMCNI